MCWCLAGKKRQLVCKSKTSESWYLKRRQGKQTVVRRRAFRHVQEGWGEKHGHRGKRRSGLGSINALGSNIPGGAEEIGAHAPFQRRQVAAGSMGGFFSRVEA